MIAPPSPSTDRRPRPSPGRPAARRRTASLRPPRALALTLAAAALALPLVAGCGGEPVAEPPPPRPVRWIEVAPAGAGLSRTLAGVARAGVESRLSFRVGGTVRELAVEVGDRVRRGTVLARLDPTDYELKVEEAEAARAQAEAALRKAEADYDRVRALYENNNASKSDLDAARAAAESATAQVEAGDKRLAQARQQVGYTVLAAPLEGAIAEVAVEVNENVQAGQKVVLLTSVAQPEVAVAVPEGLIARLSQGQPVTVAFDALPGREFAATLAEVGVAATGNATTFEVTARLADADPEIRSGMAAEVTFRFAPEREGPIVVPGVAVVEDREGRFVFVLEGAGGETGTVHRRAVTVGSPADGGLELLAGVEPGERVVTAGVRRLADGMTVRLLESDGGGG